MYSKSLNNMMLCSFNKKEKFLRYSLFTMSIIATFICLMSEGESCLNGLKYYWILPFVFSIVVLCSKNAFYLFKDCSLAIMLIYIQMVLRYILTPVSLYIDNNYNQIHLDQNYSTAIWLMVYEMILVVWCLNFLAPRIITKTNTTKIKEIHLDEKSNQNITHVTVPILIVFWIIIVATSEMKKSLLVFSVSSENHKSYTDLLNSISSVYIIFYDIGLVLIYVLILKFIKNLRMLESMKIVIAVLVSIFYISSSWSSMSGGVSRWGLLKSGIVSLYVLMSFFQKHKKKIAFGGLLIICFIILIGSLYKILLMGYDSSLENVMEIFISPVAFNEYFAGVVPVSNGITVMNYLKNNISFINSIVDTVGNFPYVLKILNVTTPSTSTLYLNYLNVNNLIIPSIAQGYAVFGFIGAPIYSCILSLLAIYCNKMFSSSSKIEIRVYWLIVTIWCSLFMATNIFIIHREICASIIALIILTIDKKIILK